MTDEPIILKFDALTAKIPPEDLLVKILFRDDWKLGDEILLDDQTAWEVIRITPVVPQRFKTRLFREVEITFRRIYD